jgi:hypothetical protein
VVESQWDKPTIVQKKKQKKEQTKEMIKQQVKEDENDEDIKVEKFCNATFPSFTTIRKKIRQLLKYRGSLPVPQKYIKEFYKTRNEMSSDESKDQLLVTLSFLKDNISTLCRNLASFQISELSEETWTYRCYICHHDEILGKEAQQGLIKQRLPEFISLLNAELPAYKRLLFVRFRVSFF